MTDIDDREDRRRDLANFANAGGQLNQPTPGGHALVRATTGLAERVIGAQPVAVYRDEAKILQKLSALAAAAGSDWLYRFPVRKKEGGQDWIEGASIKLANDVARIFGNNINEIREIDTGDSWTFYARFTDIETGFSMERAYRQRKSQTSMRTKDAERQLDISYQIGQSKAIRNCIVNALQIYADYAFEQARNSLVDKIGKDLATWRARTIEAIGRIPVDLHRVQLVVGRAAKDWLAPDIAQIIACMKSIADGMATADEVFPPLDTSKDVVQNADAVKETAQQGHREPHVEAPTLADTAGTTAQRTGATTQVPGAGAVETANPAESQAKTAAASSIAATTPDEAYRRGVEAFRAGMREKAVPPEWRGVDSHSTSLAAAWIKGWRFAESTTPKKPS